MSDVTLLSPTAIPHLLATHMVKSSSRSTTPTVTDLAAVISEVTLQTQTAGASILTIELIDPQFSLQASGFLDVDDEGLLDEIEVNFPEGSSSWWRLCMVQGSADYTSPNLTLTFEDRIVSYLRDKWGPKAIAPGSTTRAQFIKQLVDEVGRGDGLQPIKFVCPSLNVVQKIASTPGADGSVTPPKKAQAASDKANKSRGVGRGAAVTVKGATPTATQIDLMNEVLGIANDLHAGSLASEALIEACIQENDFTNNPGGDGTSNGLLQFTSSTAASLGIDPLNVKQCVTAFLTRAYTAAMAGTGSKGAIDYARKFPSSTPDQVAQAAQGSAFPHAYAQWEGEAKAIVAAYGGVTLGSQIPDTATAAPLSDISQLTRGTPDDPDESSWDCITRLASEVAWYAFSNADTLYYIEGPDLHAQRPAAYITRFPAIDLRWTLVDGQTGSKSLDVVVAPSPSYTFDNTSFVYRSTHTRKGKLIRKSRIAKPQTPSEIQLNLVCAIDYLAAGDVIVFHDCGPMNGRWLITDATRNCLADTFTQFTLAPPQAPTPEPQATSTGHAASARPGSPSVSVSPSGYINPFVAVTGLTPKRIDMGVDYGGAGPIRALGNARIFCTAGPGWPGGTFIGYTLLDGPYQGKHVFHAENITPTVRVGQVVKAGDQVGVMHDAYPFTESGWASGTGDSTLAAALNQQAPGDPGAWSSAAGASFNRLLVSLGCPSGISQGPAHGTMPAGYP